MTALAFLHACRTYALLGLTAASLLSASRQPKRLVVELHRKQKENARQVSARNLQTSDAATDSGHRIVLVNNADMQYFLEVTVGGSCKYENVSSQQTFLVLPDTGSPDLWLPSINCQSCDFPKYNPKMSCSSSAIGEKLSFQYADGTEVSGTALTDSVQIGDISVNKQFLVQVDSKLGGSGLSNGILGLSLYPYEYLLNGQLWQWLRKGVTQNSQKRAFIWDLFAQHPSLPRQFSLFLSGLDGAHPSRLVFGDPDVRSYAKEDFVYSRGGNLNLWSATFWSIAWSGAEQVIDFPTSSLHGMLGGVPALIDSGTSMIILGPDIYDKLVAQILDLIPACLKFERCECPSDMSVLPDLVFTFAGDGLLDEYFSICMMPDEYLIRRESSWGTPTCQLAFDRAPASQNLVVLGMVFLRSFYTTFDVDRQRIGFARSIGSPAPEGLICKANPPKVWGVTLPSSYAIFFAALCFAVVGGGFLGYCVIGRFMDSPHSEEEVKGLLSNKGPTKNVIKPLES